MQTIAFALFLEKVRHSFTSLTPKVRGFQFRYNTIDHTNSFFLGSGFRDFWTQQVAPGKQWRQLFSVCVALNGFVALQFLCHCMNYMSDRSLYRRYVEIQNARSMLHVFPLLLYHDDFRIFDMVEFTTRASIFF